MSTEKSICEKTEITKYFEDKYLKSPALVELLAKKHGHITNTFDQKNMRFKLSVYDLEIVKANTDIFHSMQSTFLWKPQPKHLRTFVRDIDFDVFAPSELQADLKKLIGIIYSCTDEYRKG